MGIEEKEQLVLVALPDTTDFWRKDGPILVHLLEENGFSVLWVTSSKDVLPEINTQRPSAILTLSDWALEIGLMSFVKGKIPTVCLISQETWQNHRDTWFEELFHPPLHEYVSIPGGMEEIIIRLKGVMNVLE